MEDPDNPPNEESIKLRIAVQQAINTAHPRASNRPTTDERSVTQAKDFWPTIEKARQILHLAQQESFTPEQFAKLDDTLIRRLDFIYRNVRDWTIQDTTLEDVTMMAMDELKLHPDWYPYVEKSVETGKAPDDVRPDASHFYQVRHIENDTTVVIALEQGLTRKDYIAAWDGIAPFLKKPIDAGWLGRGTEFTRNYTDHSEGLTYRQILEKNYPHITDYEQREAKLEAIKKQIQRERNRRKNLGTQ